MSTEQRDPIGPWLRRLGMLTASPKVSVDEVRAALALYEDMLRGKYPASAFTQQSLQAVAAGSKFFPTYGELCDRLSAFWTKPTTPPKPAIAGAKAGAGYWHSFIANRLVAGGNRAHLLSLAKRYAEPDELAGIMRAFFTDDLRAEEQHAAEVRRDKARAVEAVVEAVAKSLSRRKPPRPATSADPFAPVEPKPAVDPHAPGRPLTLPEMHRKLFRLQREAASPDPPPNVADRIARLQENITALSGPGGTA
jgi:hypothetical protein